jgi:hypothetical protein
MLLLKDAFGAYANFTLIFLCLTVIIHQTPNHEAYLVTLSSSFQKDVYITGDYDLNV